MRSGASVAKRAICLELLCQRAALEAQAPELGEDASDYVAGLGAVVDRLGLEPSFAEGELALVRSPIGKLDADSPLFDLGLADISILLWALGRLPKLLTVNEIGDAIGDISSAGVFATVEGNLDAARAAIDEAALRPQKEIEPILLDAAKANALAVTSNPNEAQRDVPPASVFYVLPWLLSDDHAWGLPVELQAGPELGGMLFTIDGVKMPDDEDDEED